MYSWKLIYQDVFILLKNVFSLFKPKFLLVDKEPSTN